MKNKQAIISRFGNASQIKIVETDIPEPKENEVLIKTEAATVSSTDITIRKGLYPLLKNKPPFCLGYDFVGIVTKIGSSVTNVKVGDRVADICQIGGNANYICCNSKNLLVVDKTMDATLIAPLVLSGMTAFQIYKYAAKTAANNSFLVHGGSGAVGNILVQLCKLNKVNVIATTSTSKLKSVEMLGAEAIDYKSKDYFSQLKLMAKNGFDAVLDFSNQKSINRSFSLLKPKGRMILCGLLTTQRKMKSKTLLNFIKFGFEFGCMMIKRMWWNTFTNKEVTFFGIADSKKDFPERYQNDLNELINLVKAGKLKPIIHQTFSLDQVSTAHQLFDEANTTGSVVILNN